MWERCRGVRGCALRQRVLQYRRMQWQCIHAHHGSRVRVALLAPGFTIQPIHLRVLSEHTFDQTRQACPQSARERSGRCDTSRPIANKTLITYARSWFLFLDTEMTADPREVSKEEERQTHLLSKVIRAACECESGFRPSTWIC